MLQRQADIFQNRPFSSPHWLDGKIDTVSVFITGNGAGLDDMSCTIFLIRSRKFLQKLLAHPFVASPSIQFETQLKKRLDITGCDMVQADKM